jgi:hypothetical protein
MLILLGVSAPSYETIPFLEFWGADLHNLYVFHHCSERNSPYLVSGYTCGDISGREMVYPPILYWSFSWLRATSFEVARSVWGAFILATMLLTIAVWGSVTKRTAFVYLLLLVQFPVAFSVERGNNDVIVVGLWTICYVLFKNESLFLAGLIAGLCIAAKLYPLVSVSILVLGILCGNRNSSDPSRGHALLFVWGAITSLVLISVVLPVQSVTYFTQVLPGWSSLIHPLSVYSHSLAALTEGNRALATILFAAMVSIWSLASLRGLFADTRLVFAGALALSTYFAGISYDYNLVTTYPLLAVLIDRAETKEDSVHSCAAWLVILGLVAVVGHRGVFLSAGVYGLKIHVIAQVVWLVVATRALIRPTSSQVSAGSRTSSPVAETSSIPSPKQM